MSKRWTIDSGCSLQIGPRGLRRHEVQRRQTAGCVIDEHDQGRSAGHAPRTSRAGCRRSGSVRHPSAEVYLAKILPSVRVVPPVLEGYAFKGRLACQWRQVAIAYVSRFGKNDRSEPAQAFKRFQRIYGITVIELQIFQALHGCQFGTYSYLSARLDTKFLKLERCDSCRPLCPFHRPSALTLPPQSSGSARATMPAAVNSACADARSHADSPRSAAGAPARSAAPASPPDP